MMDSSTLFLKIWNVKGDKKAVLVKTYEDLVKKGCEKLGLVQNPLIYLQDGTEIDEDVFGGLTNNTVLYFLIEGDHKPWDQSQSQPTQRCETKLSSNETEVSSPSEIILSPNSLKSWPEAFVVPEYRFSCKLKEDLAKGFLCWITKSELLGILSEEIQKYTLTPTFIQRDVVSRALVSKYPTLKSNIGEGHEAWRLKIYDRVREDVRKRGADCLRVKKRQKVGDNTTLQVPKKKSFKNSAYECITSAASSTQEIENAIEEMKNQIVLLRSKQNLKLLEENMKITYGERRKLINQNILLNDIKNIYPALFTVSGISQEFKMLKDISLHTAFIVSLKNCSELIYKICDKKSKEKKNPDTFLINILDRFNKISHIHINDSLMLAASVIPALLGEKCEYLFKEYPTETLKEDLCLGPVTPHLAVVDDMFSSSEVYIVAEQEILIECCEFLEALITLIGLYFVCNIKYPKEAEKTFIFFQTYCLQLPSEKIPSKVHSLCNKLPSVAF